MLHRVALTTAAVVTGMALVAAPAARAVLGDRSPSPSSAAIAAHPGAVPATATRRCGAEPTTAAGWQRLLDAQHGAWSGGDGAASVRLPDGRILWLFGDTWVGAVSSGGARAAGSRIVRNSLVVTDGSCVQPLPTTTDVLPGRDGTWLWPSSAVVTVAGRPGTASTVLVTAQRLRRTGTGAWSFARTGMAVAAVSVPWRGTPLVGAVSDLGRSATAWGVSLVGDGPTTWVYGTREVAGQLGRALLLARAPTATLADRRTWAYRTSTGWSARESDAVPVRSAVDGVSTVASAVHLGGRWVVVTKAHEFLDAEVVALVSAHPWGPWTARTLFAAPSSADVLRYSPAVVASSTSHHLVVAVSRTSPSLPLLQRRSELAYPTFTDVAWG